MLLRCMCGPGQRLGGDGESCVERVATLRGRGVTVQELQVQEVQGMKEVQVVARPDTPMAR